MDKAGMTNSCGGEEVMEKRTTKQSKACFEDKQVQNLKYEHLVVHGLESSVNDADLREYFEQFGKVAVAKVKEDVSTDSLQVLGFVIIRYSDHEVQKKVQSMKHTIKNHEVDITFQRYDKKYKHLIVHSLPSSISGADLKEYFEKFGQVVLSEVREDQKAAKSQGFVIMCLASFDEIWGKTHIIDGFELVVESQATPNFLVVEIATSKAVDVNAVQCQVCTDIHCDPGIPNYDVTVVITAAVAPSSRAFVQICSNDVNLPHPVVEVVRQSVHSFLPDTVLLTRKCASSISASWCM